MMKIPLRTYAFAIAAVTVTATAVTSGINSRLMATAPSEAGMVSTPASQDASASTPGPTSTEAAPSTPAPTSAEASPPTSTEAAPSTPAPTTAEASPSTSAPTSMPAAQVPADDIGLAEFGTCAGCHGETGQGNDEAFAPALAGSEGEYLLRQLVNFRTGLRGAEGDEQGLLMKSIAENIPEESLEPLVAYIQTLPGEPRPNLADRELPDIIADVVPSCAGCHGENGEGVADLQAPPLTHLSPYYIEQQLTKFAIGLRGYHPDDGPGSVMASMKDLYSDEQVRAALAEYYGRQ
jgi:cytochrome c553